MLTTDTEEQSVCVTGQCASYFYFFIIINNSPKIQRHRGITIIRINSCLDLFFSGELFLIIRR